MNPDTHPLESAHLASSNEWRRCSDQSPLPVELTLSGVAEPPGRVSEYSCRWVRSLDELRAVQRLRYEVFSQEMGVRLSTPIPGHDADCFDDHCEHLLVENLSTEEMVGTYRVLTPLQAATMVQTYADREFDLSPLSFIRQHTAELGRACVHPEHRQGGVILSLWGEMIRFLEANSLTAALGCVSVPLVHDGLAEGHYAAAVWANIQRNHMAEASLHVVPRLSLSTLNTVSSEPVLLPALLQAYLRLGAKVIGPPAWDPEFNTADFPVLLNLKDMPSRYRSRFLRHSKR
jgi:putative hemolysin